MVRYFAPLNEPTIAIAVIVENGGSGSEIAAPVAKAVIDFHLGREARILSKHLATRFRPVSADFVRQLSGSMVLKRERTLVGDLFHLDLPIVLILILVCIFGLLILFSAVGRDPDPVLAQSLKICAGFFIMFSVAQIPPVFFMRLAPWFFFFSVVLLLITFFYGTEIKGPKDG